MSSITAPRPGALATRIARLLRPAALRIGAWVSTEAAVQLDGHPPLRPAVTVVEGDPPYDGMTQKPPLLVVEIDAAKVARWLAMPLPAIWGPMGDGAVQITRGVRSARAMHETLAVPEQPELVLPVAELLREPPLANVIQLRR